jgi:opacity protein-like surface antigen
MSKKNSVMLMAAFAAMSFLSPSLSLAQAEQPKAFTPKIKTPNTSKELSSEDKAVSATVEEKDAAPLPSNTSNSGAPRRLQQHGLGLGLGQTFLMGNYAKHGSDKITLDLLYTYAASYSFDLLINAHMSEHKDENERMKVMGLTSSIKGRFVEYDNLSPYFLGGLGFYAPKAKRDTGNGAKWTDQKVTFGLNFGGGVDLRLNDNYVVGLMGQMHWPFKVQQDNQSDLKGYYFKLLVTGMYLF